MLHVPMTRPSAPRKTSDSKVRSRPVFGLTSRAGVAVDTLATAVVVPVVKSAATDSWRGSPLTSATPAGTDKTYSVFGSRGASGAIVTRRPSDDSVALPL